MNDKEIIKKHFALPDYYVFANEGYCIELELMQKARQDEREKSEAENADLRKEIERLNDLMTEGGWSYQLDLLNKHNERLVKEAKQWKSRWEKMKGGLKENLICLKNEILTVPHTTENPRKREPAIRQVRGRIMETRHILHKMHELESSGNDVPLSPADAGNGGEVPAIRGVSTKRLNAEKPKPGEGGRR